MTPHYVIDECDDLIIDGSGTTDADPGDALTYEWDLDNDGTADATGVAPVVTAATLAGFGLTLGITNSHPVSLSVTDCINISHTYDSTEH